MTDIPTFIVDDQGMPIAAIDPDQIATYGVRLAFELAAHCDDPDQLERIFAQAIDTHGDAFRYVAAAALKTVVRDVLEPLLQVTNAVGIDLRAGLTKCAQGAL